MNCIRFQNKCLVVADSVMEATLELAEKASKSSAPVLLVGESGTGKELIARFIHEKSARSQSRFISINCAAIPDGLLESELFGFERGSFTGAVAMRTGKFELANGGTLLLDEISEMSYGLQAKLLRVLQENEIDRIGGREAIPINARVIATTNRDPLELVHAGRFREDLFYRLNILRIECQPLGGRANGIASLTKSFMKEICDIHHIQPLDLADSGLNVLTAHPWPGNIRELRNAIERAIVNGAHTLDEKAFAFLPRGNLKTSSPSLNLEMVELNHIHKVLSQCSGNRTHAAKALGISVRTLRNKLNIREKNSA